MFPFDEKMIAFKVISFLPNDKPKNGGKGCMRQINKYPIVIRKIIRRQHVYHYYLSN